MSGTTPFKVFSGTNSRYLAEKSATAWAVNLVI